MESMMEEGAVMRVSAPACFCNSPMANMRASRALARAFAPANPRSELLSDIVDRLSKPTAITVSRISRLSVTTRAKPFACAVWDFI